MAPRNSGITSKISTRYLGTKEYQVVLSLVLLLVLQELVVILTLLTISLG